MGGVFAGKELAIKMERKYISIYINSQLRSIGVWMIEGIPQDVV